MSIVHRRQDTEVLKRSSVIAAAGLHAIDHNNNNVAVVNSALQVNLQNRWRCGLAHHVR